MRMVEANRSERIKKIENRHLPESLADRPAVDLAEALVDLEGPFAVLVPLPTGPSECPDK